MLPKCNFQNHKGHFEFKNSLSPAINSFPSTLLHCQCQHLEKEAFKYRLFDLKLPYCCSFNLKACQAEDFVTLFKKQKLFSVKNKNIWFIYNVRLFFLYLLLYLVMLTYMECNSWRPFFYWLKFSRCHIRWWRLNSQSWRYLTCWWSCKSRSLGFRKLLELLSFSNLYSSGFYKAIFIELGPSWFWEFVMWLRSWHF